MKNIIIIGGDKQPIPPIKGGAVENLTQMFIDENEVAKEFNIDVISVFDKDIINSKKSINYEYCKYFYVKNNKNFLKKLKFIIVQLLNKFFKKGMIFSSSYVTSILNVIKKNKLNPEIIIVENYIDCIIRLKKEFPSSQIILHLHNDKLNNEIINGKKIVECCSKIITVSEYISKRVRTIPQAHYKTYTLINSICTSKFGNDENRENAINLRKKYGIQDDNFVVLFSGRIAKTKGVLELLKAFKKINIKKFKLVIIGNSWYGKEVKNDKYLDQIRKEFYNMDGIIFTGYVDYEEMPDYYCIADVITIPSIWQEPCSLTLFEAMSSNVPLITTNTGGTKEVVKENAILLEVDDNFVEKLKEAIIYVYNNPDNAKDMSQKAFEYIQEYNPRRYYLEICKIINDINKNLK